MIIFLSFLSICLFVYSYLLINTHAMREEKKTFATDFVLGKSSGDSISWGNTARIKQQKRMCVMFMSVM